MDQTPQLPTELPDVVPGLAVAEGTVVAEASPTSLIIRSKTGLFLALGFGGAIAAITVGWLETHRPADDGFQFHIGGRGAFEVAACGVLGVIAMLMHLYHQITIDGYRGTVEVRWLLGLFTKRFGDELTAVEIEICSVHSSKNEKCRVSLIDAAGKRRVSLGQRDVKHEESVNLVAVAVHVSQMLKLPLRAQFLPDKGHPALVAALEQLRR